MRTGCFLNGCCFGTVTSLPWGVTFPTGSSAWALQILSGESSLFDFAAQPKPVHPTELYEIIAAAVFGALAMWLLLRHRSSPARRTPAGVPFLVFALGFTLFRLADDFLRATAAHLFPAGLALSGALRAHMLARGRIVGLACADFSATPVNRRREWWRPVTYPGALPSTQDHVALGAKLVEFAGWEMPLSYPAGTVAEHLATRRTAGLFDVSHMGRIVVDGPRALEFLQRVLSNNAAALDLLQAQYTFIPTETGGAVDDAYLYRLRRAASSCWW